MKFDSEKESFKKEGKMERIIIIIVFCLVIFSCALSDKPISVPLKLNEALVGGKVKILFNGEDVSKNASIQFSNTFGGTYKFFPDSIGIMISKINVGKGYLNKIIYADISEKIKRENAKFVISEPNQIYYLGDITINLKGARLYMDELIAEIIGGALGGWGDKYDTY